MILFAEVFAFFSKAAGLRRVTLQRNTKKYPLITLWIVAGVMQCFIPSISSRIGRS
jgi:hypothetical protein